MNSNAFYRRKFLPRSMSRFGQRQATLKLSYLNVIGRYQVSIDSRIIQILALEIMRPLDIVGKVDDTAGVGI